MAKFTIIIPYYQKQTGILRRALASVFAQTYQDFDIVIVDDQSPLPIEAELEGLADEQRASIHVIKQPNAGPGGARNRGLDNVPAQTEFVAFLDSDDVWTKDHLQNAHESMTRFSSDCYWASITGGDAFYYHFDMAELEKTESRHAAFGRPLVLEVPEFSQASCSGIGASCTSPAWSSGESCSSEIRFEAELRLAAEDVLFFCDCAHCSRAHHPLQRGRRCARRGRQYLPQHRQ